MPTPDEILSAIAPELDTVDSGIRQVHIDLAESQTGEVYGDSRDYAVALLAAHTLTVSNRGGNAGAVSQVKEGQLSMGFNVKSDATALESTSYGAELLRLRRMHVMSARTVLV